MPAAFARRERRRQPSKRATGTVHVHACIHLCAFFLYVRRILNRVVCGWWWEGCGVVVIVGRVLVRASTKRKLNVSVRDARARINLIQFKFHHKSNGVCAQCFARMCASAKLSFCRAAHRCAIKEIHRIPPTHTHFFLCVQSLFVHAVHHETWKIVLNYSGIICATSALCASACSVETRASPAQARPAVEHFGTN